jgi:hypothetical protein
MVDCQVFDIVIDLEHAPVTSARPLAINVIEEVVAKRDAPRLAPEATLVIPAEQANSARSVTDDVIENSDVFDNGPWGPPVLGADGKSERVARLGGDPTVLEDVSLDSHATGIFELQQVLDDPSLARIGGVPNSPRKPLTDVIVLNQDVGGTMFAILGKAPPNMMFSPAASR